jgi:hypothetical protein
MMTRVAAQATPTSMHHRRIRLVVLEAVVAKIPLRTPVAIQAMDQMLELMMASLKTQVAIPAARVLEPATILERAMILEPVMANLKTQRAMARQVTQ